MYQLFEQIRIAKKDKQLLQTKSQTERRTDKQISANTSQDKTNYIHKFRSIKGSTEILSDFFQDSLLNKLTRDKFNMDHQMEKDTMKLVKGDVSHYHDQQKLKLKTQTRDNKYVITEGNLSSTSQQPLAKFQYQSKNNTKQKMFQVQFNEVHFEKQKLRNRLQIPGLSKMSSFTQSYSTHMLDGAYSSIVNVQQSLVSNVQQSPVSNVKQSLVLSINQPDLIVNLTRDLNEFLLNKNADNPGGRIQSIRLQQWFYTQKELILPLDLGLLQNQVTKNKIEGIIQVTIQELIRQIKLECGERGQLLEQLQDFSLMYQHHIQDLTILQNEKVQVTSLEEFNRIHKYYKEKHKEDRQEIESSQIKYILDQKTHDFDILKLNEQLQQFSKTKSLLHDYKKAVYLLRRKIDSLKNELEYVIQREKQKVSCLTMKLRNEISDTTSIYQTSRSQAIESQGEINQHRSSTIFYNPDQLSKLKSQTDINQKVKSQTEVKEENSDDDSNQSMQNLFTDLLDDKNIVEINNMIMHMDKVVKVAEYAQQIEEDFLKQYQCEIGTQTQICLVSKNFDLILKNQKIIDQVLENEELKVQVEMNLKFIEDRLTQYTSQTQMNNLIIKQFCSQGSAQNLNTSQFNHQTSGDESVLHEKSPINDGQFPSIFASRGSMLQQTESIDSRSLDETPSNQILLQVNQVEVEYRSRQSRLVSPVTPFTNQRKQHPDIEKLKFLVTMLKTKELQLHIIEKTLEQTKAEFKQIKSKAIDNESIVNNLMIEIQNLKLEMQGMRKIDLDDSTTLALKQSELEGRIKGKKVRKQASQAKLMMFSGPHLGQKITFTYDFQKITNVGLQIVEKVRAKQVKKLKNFMPIKLLMKQISLIYQDKLIQQKDQQQLKDQDMASFTYSYFLSQFGISKIADQKFLILILSVKHHKSIMRVNVFAKFLGLFDKGINYNIDELKKQLLGTAIQDNESDSINYTPYIRALQYIGTYADSRMTQEEKEELKKEVDIMKELDPKNINKAGLIDFDQLMILLFSRYRILISRAKEYVINAFAACDLDGNGMCNYEEWYLLLRHIEPNRLSHEQVSEIFFTNADLLEEGEQNFSFEKFALVCVEHGLFSDEAQNTFISSKGTRSEMMKQFTNVYAQWQIQKQIIEQRFDKITFLASEKLDHWREIIDSLQKKIEEVHSKLDTPGIDKKIKPLLIAYLLLLNESILLEELQEDQEDNSSQSDVSIQQIPSPSPPPQ